MKKSIALAALFALAACNQAANEEPSAPATDTAANDMDAPSSVLEGEKPGFEAVAPGTYEVTRTGGEVDYIEIHPGMTFSRVASDGTATGGSIVMKGGKTCFIVEGQSDENCFTDSAPDQSGVVKATGPNGDVSTVKPVTGNLEDHVKKSA